MRQQINLYQERLIDKPQPWQARQAVLLLLLTACGLLALAGYFYWQADARSAQATRLQGERDSLSERVAGLEEQYPASQKNVLLEEKLKQLERRIQGQRQALDFFAAGEDRNQSMIATLEGLARHQAEGVWLRQVRLEQAGRQVRLAGSAQRPEQVPAYLQLLGNNFVFAGKLFDRLQLERLKEQPHQVDFVLESTQEGN
jgi:hypothetical protein